MTQSSFAPPVIFGEVLFDCFPGGEAVLGGAPFNVAWHLQAFGAAPKLISRIGSDNHGSTIANAMTEWDMDLSGLQTDPLLPTGRVDITLNEEKEPCYDICHPVAYDNMAAAGLPDVSNAGLLYHGSLALRSPETRTTFQALRKATSAPVFLDVNLRAPWWQREQVMTLVEDADWVKLNQDELEALCRFHGSTTERVRSWISTYNLSGVILTMGANGARVITAEECLVASPPRVKNVVDPVGAGDGFAAVFILGLLHRWDLTQTLVRAQDFAAAIVTQRGATSPDTSLYSRFMTEWADHT